MNDWLGLPLMTSCGVRIATPVPSRHVAGETPGAFTVFFLDVETPPFVDSFLRDTIEFPNFVSLPGKSLKRIGNFHQFSIPAIYASWMFLKLPI